VRDYSIKDAAALMGVHPETLRRLARAGRLPGTYKIGRQWRIATEALEHVRGEAQRRRYNPDGMALEDIEWDPEHGFEPPDVQERPRPVKPG
jgi:excisionase family DNA binding protein